MRPQCRFTTVVWAGLLAWFASSVVPAAAAAPDVVPLRFVNGLPFVDVRIGAAHSVMMVDSGGKLGIAVPEAAVKAAGTVTLLQEQARFKDIHGQPYSVPKLVAKAVTVGRTRLETVDGMLHSEWGGAPEGPDAPLTRARKGGAIGLAAFGARPLMFDYAHGTLTIYAPGQGPHEGDAGWLALPLDFDRVGPQVTLRVAGKPLKFVLDTGAQVVLVDPASLPAGAVAPCPAGSVAEGCDPNLIADVRDAAGHPLGALHAYRQALGGAPFDGLLGAPFFASHRVLFDVAAHRVLIAPADGAPAP